jgi:hypothetical protein
VVDAWKGCTDWGQSYPNVRESSYELQVWRCHDGLVSLSHHVQGAEYGPGKVFEGMAFRFR